MNEETEKWVGKAEGDFEGAQTLLKRRSATTAHLICFACQQSAEKYLKAYLVEENIKFSKTHFLVRELLPACEGKDSEFRVLARQLALLDPFAVDFRYPSESPTLEEARLAVEAASQVRRFVRTKLNLGPQQELL